MCSGFSSAFAIDGQPPGPGQPGTTLHHAGCLGASVSEKDALSQNVLEPRARHALRLDEKVSVANALVIRS